MTICILHVGCPKTGTTSIQQTLGWKLKDPAFRLVSRDAQWGNSALGVLFKQKPASYLRAKGVSVKDIDRLKKYYLRALDASLRHAREAKVIPILSGEVAYRFTESEMRHVKMFLAERGFDCRIALCIRPTHDISESGFQQHIKTFHSSPEKLKRLISSRFMSYKERIRVLDKVFSRDYVDVFAFNPKWFREGCAVLNFCDRYGITISSADVVRTNESLNLNVIKLLYAWSVYGERTKCNGYNLLRTRLIARKLQSLAGPRLTFHRDLIPEQLDEHAREQPALEERLGHPFPASWRTRAPDEGIRSLEELIDYPQEVLEWLARETGQKVVALGKGTSAAEQVAKQIESLHLLSDPKILSSALRSWWESKVHHLGREWRS